MNEMTSQEQQPWYRINNIDTLDSPAFVIYPDRVKKNIGRALAMVGEVQRLRPHVKTHKCAEVTRLLLEAGIQKFKCATIAEGEMLGACGAPDVLLAYQPAGPKADRLLALMERYPETGFSCLIDNLQAARSLQQKLEGTRLLLPVFIDLNVGMNRTGICPGEAVELFAQLATFGNVRPLGLHAYDGHINEPDLARRTLLCEEAFVPVFKAKAALEAKGFRNVVVVAGGSPTFPIHAKRTDVECSPGTFVYWDDGYGQAFPEQPFEPAALVISRVVSLPGEGLLCTDLGHKSVAAENPLQRRVRFVNATDLEAVGQSEEHLVLRTSADHSFAVGDVLYGMPVHVCPTCALYERAYVIENGNVTAEWKTVARDRKITI